MNPEFAAMIAEFRTYANPATADALERFMQAMEDLHDAYVLEGLKPKGEATCCADSAGHMVRLWFETCIYDL